MLQPLLQTGGDIEVLIQVEGGVQGGAERFPLV
jgi:hypothetical protein